MRWRFRTNVVSIVIVVGSILLFPFVAQGQTVAGTIDSSEGAFWDDIQLLRGNIFVSDRTAKSVLVYDATSLALRTEILLEPYLAHTDDAPFDLAGYDATGTLYVSTHSTSATSNSRILMIDAESESVTDTLVDTCCHAFVAIDESRARLYVISLNVYKTVESFDLNTNTSLGTLDIGAIMGAGLMSWAGERSINKATGELAFSNLNHDRFLLVDGPNLTGETVSASDSRGYVPTWNWQENKLYITTIDWSGYFVHDRDTGVSGIASCVNDGTELFFSEATNRIYSGAEVNHDTTIIDGTTDSCQNLDLGDSLPDVGFVRVNHHAFFFGPFDVVVLDEDTLSVVTSMAMCGPGSGGGGISEQVIVDQTSGRVFAMLAYDLTTGEGSCILVLDDPIPIFSDGFESGSTSAWSTEN